MIAGPGHPRPVCHGCCGLWSGARQLPLACMDLRIPGSGAGEANSPWEG